MAEQLRLDPSRCALIVAELQNDVISEGGAFAGSGAPQHAREQGLVANVADLAAVARDRGVAVVHVWYVVEPGGRGFEQNAPVFRGVGRANGLVRGSWGAAPVEGMEPLDGDFVVEKMRVSAWEGTRLELLLHGLARDTLVVTGAWTHLSIEHTVRTGADKGFAMLVPADGTATINAEWQRAAIEHGIRTAARVTTCAAIKTAWNG